MPSAREHDLVDIRSDTSATLATHHFPVIATLRDEAPVNVQAQRRPRKDWGTLREPVMRRKLVEEIGAELEAQSETTSFSEQWRGAVDGVLTAVQAVVPDAAWAPKKPWISDRTMSLIAEGAKQGRARIGSSSASSASRRRHQPSVIKLNGSSA